MSTAPTPDDDSEALSREVQRRQEEIMPREDLRPYVGKWVALRKGRVVAVDIEPLALRNKPGVEKSDMLLQVPDPAINILIL
jgi:hypothetical protein